MPLFVKRSLISSEVTQVVVHPLLKNQINAFRLLFLMAFSCFIAINSSAVRADALLPVSGRYITESSLLPADVLARARLVEQQLKVLRQHLNLPENTIVPITVENAQPREVYFQALKAHYRVNRLIFEQTSEFNPDLEYLPQENVRLTPYHVWSVTNRVFEQLQQLLLTLNIQINLKEVAAAEETTPSDVFVELLRLNRKLDGVLQQPFSPSDVYQEVTFAIHYAAKLLGKYPDVVRIPSTPPYVDNKKPSDVWLSLVDCLSLIREIILQQKQSTILINVDQVELNEIMPGDVYQMATLIVSELDYLHSLDPSLDRVVRSVSVKNKIPSDVYQRAAMLKQQLTQLKISVKPAGDLNDEQ